MKNQNIYHFVQWMAWPWPDQQRSKSFWPHVLTISWLGKIPRPYVFANFPYFNTSFSSFTLSYDQHDCSATLTDRQSSAVYQELTRMTWNIFQNIPCNSLAATIALPSACLPILVLDFLVRDMHSPMVYFLELSTQLNAVLGPWK